MEGLEDRFRPLESGPAPKILEYIGKIGILCLLFGSAAAEKALAVFQKDLPVLGNILHLGEV